MPLKFDIMFEKVLLIKGWHKVSNEPAKWKRPDGQGPRYDTACAVAEAVRQQAENGRIVSVSA